MYMLFFLCNTSRFRLNIRMLFNSPDSYTGVPDDEVNKRLPQPVLSHHNLTDVPRQQEEDVQQVASRHANPANCRSCKCSLLSRLQQCGTAANRLHPSRGRVTTRVCHRHFAAGKLSQLPVELWSGPAYVRDIGHSCRSDKDMTAFHYRHEVVRPVIVPFVRQHVTFQH